MKRPTTFLKRFLLDAGMQLRITVERDCQVIDSRFENEGFSFLTITLPTLDDALLHGLSVGRITPNDFPGFKPVSRSGRLPALLQGFFIRVFERDGRLRDDPCIDSIRAIRQTARAFKKVLLDCSSARIARAYERYLENDRECKRNDYRSSSNFGVLHRVASYLWADLEELSGELYCFPGIFGSGATAERYKFNERCDVSEWPKRSENFFPSDYHCTHNYEVSESLTLLEEDQERPVRVVQVPKTLKTPRTISVEPSYMMLMQQSIAKPLMEYLENSFPYKSIRFKDQSVNKELARIGSIDGSLSTIDLSDASDLVSNNLVSDIFGCSPTFLGLIQACRSTRAQMPDGQLVNLNKFASMGSALCFPIEAMTFYTIVISAMVQNSGRRLSRSLLAELSAKVSVYGDDIIVPTEMVSTVMEYLESFGLKVNHSKSFTTGFFRESCGGDYYRGSDVTPVYVRRWMTSTNTLDTSLLTSFVSLSNQFYLKGYWHVSQFLRDYLEKRTNQHIPRTTHGIGCLTFASVVYNTGARWNTRTCQFEVRGPVLSSKIQRDECSTMSGALFRAFGQCEHAEGLSQFNGNIEFIDRNRSRRSEKTFVLSGSGVKSSGTALSVEPEHFDTSYSGRIFPVATPSHNPIVESIRPYTLFHKYRWCPVTKATGIRW